MQFGPASRSMSKWQATFLCLKQLPRALSDFGIEAFLTLTLTARQLIDLQATT
jgi:hypothetical protein